MFFWFVYFFLKSYLFLNHIIKKLTVIYSLYLFNFADFIFDNLIIFDNYEKKILFLFKFF